MVDLTEDDDLTRALRESQETTIWIHARLDGLKIPRMRESLRTGMACASWHVAIEHSQAIVVLVDHSLLGSATAMIRPLLEAYVRGMWLLHCASDSAVERARNDSYPNMTIIIDGLSRAGLHDWADIHERWWKALCSLTHTGPHQLILRTTPEGLGDNYTAHQIEQTLGWADGISLLTLVALATLADQHALATEAMDRMRLLAGPCAPREAE